jgi:hypothetical protein
MTLATRTKPAATVAPQGRDSIAQGAALGFVKAQCAVALKGRHSRGLRRVFGDAKVIGSGECRPVGAKLSNVVLHEGFRCAPIWAIEYDPFGVWRLVA